MSLNNIPINLQMDNVLVQAEPEYTITKGPASALYRPYVSQNYSTTMTQWDIIPNNDKSILGRDPLTRWSAEWFLTPSGVVTSVFPPGSTPAELGVCGLKYIPLQSACSSINLLINGLTITYQGNQVITPMSFYRTDQELEEFYWSSMPCQKNVGTTFDDTYGTSMSQFCPKNLNPVHDSNAVLSYMEIISDGPEGCLLRCTWEEYLVTPPFLHNKIEQHGLSGLVNNISFQFIYSSAALAAMLGYDNINGTPLDRIDFVRFVEAPQLMLKWYELPIPPIDATALHFKYPYVNATPVLTALGEIPALATDVARVSNNIQLTGIPAYLEVYVRRTINERTSFTAENFASIKTVNLIFNGSQGILGGATQGQLYEICTRHHVYVKRDDWSNHVGSVLKLAFDKDIPIPQLDLAVGSMGTFGLQVQVTFDNLENEDITMDLVVLPVYDGILEIHGGSATTNINLVTSSDLLKAAENNIGVIDDFNNSALKGALDGGSIFTEASRYIKRGAKSVGRFYESNRDNIQNALRIGKQVGSIASQLLPLIVAAGYHEDEAMDMLEAAGFSGGGFSGGRLITDNESLIDGGNLAKNKQNTIQNDIYKILSKRMNTLPAPKYVSLAGGSIRDKKKESKKPFSVLGSYKNALLKKNNSR